MNQPVTITTTTHALAVSIYALQATQGALYLLDLANAASMSDWLGQVFADVWAMVLLLAGIAAVAATQMSKDYTRPALRAESAACVALAVASLFYEVTLVRGNGIGEVVTTQSYALMVAIGCGFRVWQIRREQRRVHAALVPPQKTTPVLADEED